MRIIYKECERKIIILTDGQKPRYDRKSDWHNDDMGCDGSWSCGIHCMDI